MSSSSEAVIGRVKKGNGLRHPVLWVVTAASALLSAVFIAGSVFVFLHAPDKIQDQHLWSALKDIGPAVAGSWVLCAALLAITAAGITALVTVRDSEARTNAREAAIARVCIGEIKAFWDQCNRLELNDKLEQHIAWLKRNELTPSFATPFRRNFGEDWFVFFRVDPEALGELDEDTSSRYISLSTRCRHFASRLNWLNSCTWTPEEIDFWINYHRDTLEVLNGIYEPSKFTLRLLGSDVDPRTFKF
jgi:hypothetical protein